MYSSGLPLDLHYIVGFGQADAYSVIVSDANVYLTNRQSYASVSSYPNASQIDIGVYSTDATGESSDVRINYAPASIAQLVRFTTDVMFTRDIDDQYAYTRLSLYGNSYTDTNASVKVSYSYSVTCRRSSNIVDLITFPAVFIYDIPISYTYNSSSGYYDTSIVLDNYNRTDISQIYAQLESEGIDLRYVTINSVTVDIDNSLLANYSETIYIRDNNHPDVGLNTILGTARNSLSSLYESDDLNLSYDDLSWTDWIVNAVGSFMDFELVPGLSLAGIFAIIVGIPILIWFLRLFAGG